VENRGFWAIEAPPKRKKQMNTQGPIYRLAGHWSAFECTTCVRTHQLFVVERRLQVRPQITAAAARADMGVRSTAEHLRSNAYNC
jgi:hypothetical protein